MKALRLLLLALVPLLAASCANTKVTGSWKNPAVSDNYRPRKVLVVGLVPLGYRTELEEQMAADLQKKGVIAVASHDVTKDATTSEEVETAVRNEGFDSVLVTTFKGTKREVTYTADGVGYGPYIDTYGPVVSSTTEKAIMEADLFDARTGGKVWSATTSTYDPKNPSKEISKVVDALVKRMAKDGLT